MAINDFEVQIANLFNIPPSEYKRLSGPLKIDKLHDEQIELYSNLLDVLYARAKKVNDTSINNFKIRREISDYFKDYANYVSVHKSIHVDTTDFTIKNSIIPVINTFNVRKLIENFSSAAKLNYDRDKTPYYFDKFINFLHAETLARSDKVKTNFRLSIKPNDEDINSYTTIRDQLVSPQSTQSVPPSPPSTTKAKLVIDYEKLQGRIANFEAQTYKNIADIQNEIAAQNAKISDNKAAAEDLNNIINEQIEASIQSIRNYETSIEERLKTNHLSVLWDKRAASAARDAIISAFVLFMTIAISISIIIYYSPTISKIIELPSSITYKEHTLFALQVSRALIIAVPIILLFWAIKLIIKYFMRSLLLLDDANQRKTIMDTYLSMVKEDEANQKAFPLIMWALCRQVPGHGPDGIEPPDFTEVIKIAKDIKP